MAVKTVSDIPQLMGRTIWEVVASAGTISPKTDKIRLTGNSAIATINRPSNYTLGPITLLSTDAAPATLTAAGNIAVAVTLVRYRHCTLLYDPITSKWYPSYV